MTMKMALTTTVPSMLNTTGVIRPRFKQKACAMARTHVKLIVEEAPQSFATCSKPIVELIYH